MPLLLVGSDTWVIPSVHTVSISLQPLDPKAGKTSTILTFLLLLCEMARFLVLILRLWRVRSCLLVTVFVRSLDQ